MLELTSDASARLYLGYMAAPTSQAVKTVPLTANTPEWVHVPNTGKPVIWQLRIAVAATGPVEVCAPRNLVVGQLGTYHADAAYFALGQGCSAVTDSGASSGRAARARAGTRDPNGTYSNGFVPIARSYDLWFRVRVAQVSGTAPEMTLGLVDVDRNVYVSSNIFRPNQARTGYTWALVGSYITPPGGDTLRFQANIASQLSTDWFIASAVLLPAGSPAPTG